MPDHWRENGGRKPCPAISTDGWSCPMVQTAPHRRGGASGHIPERIPYMDVSSSAGPHEWWARKRVEYNIGLVIAEILAFIFYIAVVSYTTDILAEEETTVFTTIVQAIGYFLYLLIANIFYTCGAFIEKIFQPKNLNLYRNVSYRLGFWFSFVLPFSVPSILLYWCMFVSRYSGSFPSQ